MFGRVYRDAGQIPALDDVLGEFEAYLGEIRDDLAKAFAPGRSRRAALRAILGHGLRFSTWQSLSREGLSDRRMAGLVARWAEAKAAGG